MAWNLRRSFGCNAFQSIYYATGVWEEKGQRSHLDKSNGPLLGRHSIRCAFMPGTMSFMGLHLLPLAFIAERSPDDARFSTLMICRARGHPIVPSGVTTRARSHHMIGIKEGAIVQGEVIV